MGSVIFAGLTIVTDHTTPSVAIGRIYVVLQCGLMIYISNGTHLSICVRI